MKKAILCAIALLAAITLTGCTQQDMAKNWGGTYEIELPAGQELELVTWKESNLWILTKERPVNEDPETHYYREDSTYGIFEGEIIIHEN